MGQKVNPTGFRVGIMEDWRSRWYANKHEFSDLLVEDFKIRKFIKKKYSYAGIPRIEIERTRDAVTVILHTARPGVIIGRKGAEVEKLQEELQTLTGRRIEIKIQEVARPEIDAQLISEDIAEQLKKQLQLPADDQAGARADDGRRRQGGLGPALGPARRLGDVTERGVQPGLDPPLDAPRQDRLRLHRGQDRPGSHRRQGMGQPGRLPESGGVRWL